jgi:hypothetical protein
MLTQDDGFLVVSQLLHEVRDILAELLALSKTKRAAKSEPAVPVDLNGKYGDPIIKAKDPRDWAGETMRDRHFSECPPAYLELLAQRYDYFNQQETDQKKRHYNELDAAKARAWAARIRSGYKPKPVVTGDMPSSDDISW